MRLKNYMRWLTEAKKKHGTSFDYSKSKIDFTTQKGNNVKLTCKRHQHYFAVLPDKHLQSKYGGCRKCSDEGKRQAKLKRSKDKFFEWFDRVHKYRLSIASDFSGMTEPLVVECC